MEKMFRISYYISLRFNLKWYAFNSNKKLDIKIY